MHPVHPRQSFFSPVLFQIYCITGLLCLLAFIEPANATTHAHYTYRSDRMRAMPQRDSSIVNEVLYYGKAEKLPQQVPLNAGSFRLIYEKGFLRYVRLGAYEVVRAIYPTVRDQYWGTYLPEIRNEKIEKRSDGFRVTYEAYYDSSGIKFKWNCLIEGRSDGTIRFSLAGEALTTFKKNRVGICVLHPVKEMAGKACDVVQPDGKQYTNIFPTYIQADQPFKNIKSMRWQLPAPYGGSASLAFEDEVFETEDQRNYGDASYKTYCTPQERPKPGELQQGEKVNQTVVLSLSGVAKVAYKAPIPEFKIDNTPTSSAHAFPAIGVSQSSEQAGLSEQQLARLKALKLSHYRVEVVASQANWQDKLKQAIAEARSLALPLEILFFPGSSPVADAEEFLRTCPSEQVTLASIAVFVPQTAGSTLSQIIRTLKEGYPNVKIGAGTTGDFMGLNANRPSFNSIEFLTYSVTPQVHLFDNTSIIENLAGQYYAVESARKIALDSIQRPLDVRISPVAFKRGWRPVRALHTGDQLPRSADVRQMSLFGAGCTIGSLKALAEAGAASVTFYETVGTQGLIQSTHPIAPTVFKAPSEAVYPLYYVLKEVQNLGKAQVVKSISTQPLDFDGVVLANGKQRRILLANYRNKQQTIRVSGLSGTATIRVLDETNARQAMLQPDAYTKRGAKKLALTKGYATVELKPYAVAFIDVQE